MDVYIYIKKTDIYNKVTYPTTFHKSPNNGQTMKQKINRSNSTIHFLTCLSSSSLWNRLIIKTAVRGAGITHWVEQVICVLYSMQTPEFEGALRAYKACLPLSLSSWVLSGVLSP